MNIDTGKLVSNSTLFQKKIKEKESVDSVSKEVKKSSMDSKILNDFADIKQTGNDYKSRVVENNIKLTNYEESYSMIQFLEQQTERLERLDILSEKEKAIEIIDNSLYKGKNVFSKYEISIHNLAEQIPNIKTDIISSYNQLENEFKAIEIANQNILSINPNFSEKPFDYVKGIDSAIINNTVNLNNKRVMDLIS